MFFVISKQDYVSIFLPGSNFKWISILQIAIAVHSNLKHAIFNTTRLKKKTLCNELTLQILRGK